ncbi:hypothetical protein VNI00_010970 [Paramarasmius palmivorus]|uniref:Uncharacterized protein n=1 Tax=Paramarasmius palmivorus TaxID=297713 RepID=A0AAW0CD68_9AGAR
MSGSANGPAPKRLKFSSEDGSVQAVPAQASSKAQSVPDPNPKSPEKSTRSVESKPKRHVKKLVPPRPFPTVSTADSATGPRSAHKEGKNFICLTRKTSLGAYMQRCKNLVLKDGFKEIHLSAMGAAIPLLMQLACALPPILPYACSDIVTEMLTGTTEVMDEIIPEDEDEDITYQTRSKSTLRITIRICGGGLGSTGPRVDSKQRKENKKRKRKEGGSTEPDEMVVLQEPEQVDIEMV